jgi:hypothetical protein
VTRDALAALSECASRSTDDAITAWLTTMCWGSGPRNKWRLRQWNQALSLTDLPERLMATVTLVENGDLVAAYRSAKLPGCGESYFTKWLWVCALPTARQPATVPLIYDNRVDVVLRLLDARPAGPNQPERWLAYCAELADWATELNDRHPGWTIDSERLEHLMFERGGNDGHCLYQWLLDGR